MQRGYGEGCKTILVIRQIISKLCSFKPEFEFIFLKLILLSGFLNFCIPLKIFWNLQPILKSAYRPDQQFSIKYKDL